MNGAERMKYLHDFRRILNTNFLIKIIWKDIGIYEMLENVSKDTTAKARPPEVDVQLQKSQVKKSPRWREKSHRIMGPRFSQSIRSAVGFFFFFRPSPNFTPDDLQLSSINGRAGCEDKTLLTLIRTQSSDIFFSTARSPRGCLTGQTV